MLGFAVGAGLAVGVSSAVDPAGLLWYPTLPNPFAATVGMRDDVAAVRAAGVVMAFVALTLVVGSLFARYRVADAILRAQLRWIVFAGLIQLLLFVPFVVTRYLGGAPPDAGELLVSLGEAGSAAIPIAAAIAITRYHLFGIDTLICPEFATATAIARTMRNPAALAIEHFARGKIEMQEFKLDSTSETIGRPLSELELPAGTRIGAIVRDRGVFIPDADTRLAPGDNIVLVANTETFVEARKRFVREAAQRRKVVIMGGPIMAIWLSPAVRHMPVQKSIMRSICALATRVCRASISSSDFTCARSDAERVFSSSALRTIWSWRFCSFSAFSSDALAMSAAVFMLARYRSSICVCGCITAPSGWVEHHNLAPVLDAA